MQRRPSTPSAGSPTAPATAAAAAEADAGLYYAFFEEVLRGEGPRAADRFLAPDFVEHGASGDRQAFEVSARLDARRARFPDAVWTIEMLVSVAGLVVCHSTMTTPEWSRRSVQAWETVVIRCSAGKIAECWRACDERLLAAERDLPLAP